VRLTCGCIAFEARPGRPWAPLGPGAEPACSGLVDALANRAQTEGMRFQNRRQAGLELGRTLCDRPTGRRFVDPIVLALPRGGVIVADEVARALDAPLDILTVRKIGMPGWPEAGLGAVVGDDPPLFMEGALDYAGVSEASLADDIERERAELRRRERVYRAGRPEPLVGGRTVVLVDDGLATGVTARAALRWSRRRDPERLVLAVPVGSREAVAMLREEADEVVCLMRPLRFFAVGWWYADFEQVSDEEVLAVLAETSA
jgi:putative phosphoribosyl transferase